MVSVFPLKKGALGRTVRTDRYRYSEDPDGNPLELIDYEKDPYEWKNLVDDPEHAELKKRLQAILHESRK